MKFLVIFWLEFKYRLCRASTWLLFIALVVIAFLMARHSSPAAALHEDFFLKVPCQTAKTILVCSLVWLVGAAVVAGKTAARDVPTGMHSLLYSTPISEAEYRGGRFFGAVLVNSLVQLAVVAGTLLGAYLQGADGEIISPFPLAGYLTAYGFIALPSAFIGTVIQFCLASNIGRPMVNFLVTALLFVMAYVVGIFVLFPGVTDVIIPE